jgi:hypothetical protein
MVLPSNVDSLVLNITVTCSFPSGSSAPSPPLSHVSDDSFSSLTRFPPIPSVFCLFPGYSLLYNASEPASIHGMLRISLYTKVQGQR